MPHSNDEPQTPVAAANNGSFAAVTPASASNLTIAIEGAGGGSTNMAGTPAAVYRVATQAVTPNVMVAQTPDGRVLPLVATPRGPFAGTVGGVNSNQGNLQAPPRGPFAANSVNNNQETRQASPAPQGLYAVDAISGIPLQGNPHPILRGPIAGGPFTSHNTTAPLAGASGTTTPGDANATDIAPPSARRSAPTPATVAKTREQDTLTTAKNQLFPTQQQPTHPYQGVVADTALMPQGGVSALRGNSVEGFHDSHQQFTIAVRDFHDKESHYKDMLLDSTVKLDLATALLLHIKVDMLDQSDRIGALNASYNESIQAIATE